MDRKIATPVLLLITLPLLGCWEMNRTYQTVPLAGDVAGLLRFEGRWFDEEGRLMAVVSGAPRPHLSVLTPKDLPPKDARLWNGQIVFHLGNDRTRIALRFTGGDEIVVRMLGDPSSQCGYIFTAFPVLSLVRNPSGAWFLRQNLRKAKEIGADAAKKGYDETMDLLARVL